jgi:hypothetical protein
MYRYARTLFLERGGDPRVLDELPMADIRDWLAVNDVLEVRSSLGGLPED